MFRKAACAVDIRALGAARQVYVTVQVGSAERDAGATWSVDGSEVALNE